jgi:putative endonuclease
MTIWRKRLGDKGEKLAEAHLKKKGYQIIDRNIRTRFGEMDLVAMEGSELVFCEVRSRGGPALHEAAESIGEKKQRQLVRLAEAYLQKRSDLADYACRFDAILVQKNQGVWTVKIIEDAFRPGW